MSESGSHPNENLRLACVFLGFAGLWLLLDRSASLLGSFRGEMGLVVCLAVLGAALVLELLLARASLPAALSLLGLRPSRAAGAIWSVATCAAMLCYYPVFSFVTGAEISLRADWLLLLPGLFTQGGIAEEVVFRGFLFRHVREGRSFRRAAILSSVPFVAVHLLLFLTLDFAIALSALLLALCISFPLAWLFERSNNSIWPCALVHFVVHGSIKLVEVPSENFLAMAAGWMALGAIAPWIFFLVLRNRPTAPLFVHQR